MTWAMSVKSEQNEISRDTVCTCKRCNHDLARDCVKLKCTCCQSDDHSMILDGMIGFGDIHKKETVR